MNENIFQQAWDFWMSHGTKILGTLSTVDMALLTLKAQSPEMFGSTMTTWLTIGGAVLGALTIQRGNANTNAIATAVVAKQESQGLSPLQGSVKP